MDESQNIEGSENGKNEDLQKKDSNINQPPEKQTESNQVDVKEFIKNMPAPFRKTIETAMMQFSSSGGRIGHPLFDKFNDKHIDKFLDYSQEDDNNLYKLRSTNRWFTLIYTIVGIGFLIFLIIFLLPSNKDLLVEILKLIVIFAAGVGGGYGLKSHLNKQK